MPQPVFKISLQHCLCSSTGLCRKFQEGGLISIIAFNIFHYPYLILLEHDTKEQFDCEQIQNKLFLLIIPCFNFLFMVHWIYKKQRWWWERGFTRHLMGGCFIYYTCFGHWEGFIKSKKTGDAEPWKNLIRHHHRAHHQIENIINKYLFNFVQRSIQ